MRLPTCVGGVAQAENTQIPGHELAPGGKSPGGGRRDPRGARGEGPERGVCWKSGAPWRGAPGGSPQGTLEALLGENTEEERRDVLRD